MTNGALTTIIQFHQSQHLIKKSSYKLYHLFAGGYCGFAPEIGNGFFVSGTGTRGGDVITYACNDGYVMRGSASVMCTSNNEWQEPPICLCE